MAYLRVRNWDQFQHYKNRSPPWIKLHRELLTSRTWVTLDDASRVLAIACMLLAAATDNKIPADPEYLARVAYLRGSVDWTGLIKCQFIDFVSEDGDVLADASTAQANAPKSCSEERRGEESREETEGAIAPSRATKSSRRVPSDFTPDETHALSQVPDLDYPAEVQKFRDWEFKTPRKDWPACWRTWIANAKERGSYARRPPTSSDGLDDYRKQGWKFEGDRG